LEVPFFVRPGCEFLGVVPGTFGDEVGGFAAEVDAHIDRFPAGDAEAIGDLFFNVEFTWFEGLAGPGNRMHAAEHEPADGLSKRVPEVDVPDVIEAEDVEGVNDAG